MCGIDATPAAAGPLRPSTVAKAIAFPAARCTAFQRATASSARLAGFGAVDDRSPRGVETRALPTPGTLPDWVTKSGLLLGSTTPISDQRLGELYPTRAAYLRQYDMDAGKAIRASFVLRDDRAALRAFADPSRIAG